ncbi:replication protein [Pseudoalteromonas spongiae]|uniref:replication protein n=1 Tax=Pseudoalteromonas spongiae TaxID=298657 RepID=UPI000C2D0847|nr:replication protein [Pseudoalteromonas spongiae]
MTNTANVINLFESNVEEEQVSPQENEVKFVKADVERGFDRLAHDITDALRKPPVKLSGREYQVIHAVISKTYRFHKKTDWISNGQLSDLTDIAESNISKVVASLVKKGVLIRSGKKHIGINPIVSEWGNSENTKNENSQKRLNNKSKTTKKLVKNDSLQKKEITTKEIVSKDTGISPEQIQKLFNESLGELSQVKKLSESRKRTIRARCKDLKTIADWQSFFTKIFASDFLMGRTKQWKASFDWILKESNYVKIIEGNYDNKSFSGANNQTVADPNWYEDLGF